MTGEEGTASNQPRVPRVVVSLTHAALFAVAALATLDLASEPFVGAFTAAPLFLPLTVILIGAGRFSAGVAGGRPLLVAGDLSVILALALDFATTDSSVLSSGRLVAVLAITLGLIAIAVTLLSPRGSSGRIERTRRDRRMLVVLVALDVISVIGLSLMTRANVGIDYAVRFGLATAIFDLAIFSAWWWGTRWPIALAGAAGLVQVLIPGPTGGPDTLRLLLYVVPNLVGIAAGFVGPRFVSDHEGLLEASPEAPSSGVWLVLGGLLWPLLVLIGLYPPVLDLCLACGVAVPGEQLLVSLSLLSIAVVPIAVLVSVLRGSHGDPFGRVTLGLLLAAALLILAEIVIGTDRSSRFSWLGLAGAPALLVLIGALVALVRPRRLVRTGRVAALGAGGLLVLWAWSVRGFGIPTALVGASFVVSSMTQAAVTAIGIAWESSRARTIGAPAPSSPQAPPP